MFKIFILWMGCAILAFGCSVSPELVNISTHTPAPTSTKSLFATPTIARTHPVTLTPAPLPSSTAINPIEICSPLLGITLQELPKTIFNPYNPPPPGSDDPHQGIDFSDLDPETKIALEGRPVQAVLAGTVAAIINDRFPYGNALMIETPLTTFSEAWLHAILPSPPDPTSIIRPNLTCPEIEAHFGDLSTGQSIYLLYAHLKEPILLIPGEMVSCGQIVNQIGNSGNSLNPHLHLEARIGPSGNRFESMAHYDTSATTKEMAEYCRWRISGQFHLIDPMDLLSMRP